MSNTLEPKYKEGQIVRKVRGARFWGKIAGAPYKTTEDGEWHYNVMAIQIEFFGTVHIMVESQIGPCDFEDGDRWMTGIENGL